MSGLNALDIDGFKDYIDSNDFLAGGSMATLTIRNLDDTLKARLRMSAAQHGCSMEEEVRRILKKSLLREGSSTGLGSRIVRRFAAVGGVVLPVVARSLPRTAPPFASDEER